MTNEMEEQLVSRTGQVDQLIPPPWPTRHRVALGAIVVAVAAFVGAGWWAGVFTPRLAAETVGGEWQEGTVIDQRVTDVDVTLRLRITNHGRFAAVLEDWRPPQTRGIVWGEQLEPLPIELAPGESTEVTLRLHVPDCGHVDARGSQQVVLRGHGLLAVNHPRPVDVPGDYSAPPWRYWDDRHRALAGGNGSWIYDALSWPCDPEAESEGPPAG